ncbi:MAG TPA: TonB-dependent receptor, partial [Sphingomicrobium sp.]|nr:TonB-dependent receptor [Sphingomicrobium sp.]
MRISALLLIGTAAIAISVPGLAQTQPEDTAQAADQPASQPAATDVSDEIIVTGTRRLDRTVTNSASPIDVISSAELTNQPTANLLDTIKNIVPSFYVPQNTISDASTFVRAPSLRGLPADEV